MTAKACATCLAKVDFVEHDLIRVCNAVESSRECQHGNDAQGELVVPVSCDCGFGLGLNLRQDIVVPVRDTVAGGRGAALPASSPLLQCRLRARHCGLSGPLVRVRGREKTLLK